MIDLFNGASGLSINTGDMEGRRKCGVLNAMNTTLSPSSSPSIGSSATAATRPANRLPLLPKVAFTAFMAVLVPVYWVRYGPTNFLYFCDLALFLTLAALWLENRLLAAMAGVGIILPQLVWCTDFVGNCFGVHLTGMTNYMFDANRSLFLRGLSSFHGWLPLLLLWMIRRLGYDKRAFAWWTVIAILACCVSYAFIPGPSVEGAKGLTPVNVNYVYGFSDERAQTWLPQPVFFVAWLAALTFLVYLPTHLALKKWFTRGGSCDTCPNACAKKSAL